MAVDLKGRSFVKLLDYEPLEIRYLLDLAEELKAEKYAGKEEPQLVGKNIVLIFEKTSTRTRCAFEVAAFDQGANVTMLSGRQMWKPGKSTPACRSGTASPTNSTPPRCSLTC